MTGIRGGTGLREGRKSAAKKNRTKIFFFFSRSVYACLGAGARVWENGGWKRAESRERKVGNVRLSARFSGSRVGVAGERCQEGQMGSTEHTENTEKKEIGTTERQRDRMENKGNPGGDVAIRSGPSFFFRVFRVFRGPPFPRPLPTSRSLVQVHPMRVFRSLRFPDSTRGLRGLPLRPFSRFLWLSSGVAMKNGHKKREEPRKERQNSPKSKGNGEEVRNRPYPLHPTYSPLSAILRRPPSFAPRPLFLCDPTAPQPLPNRSPTAPQPLPN
jgi:hypothetical protein